MALLKSSIHHVPRVPVTFYRPPAKSSWSVISNQAQKWDKDAKCQKSRKSQFCWVPLLMYFYFCLMVFLDQTREKIQVCRELAVPRHKEKASNTEKGSATKIRGSEEYTHRRKGWGNRLQGNRSAGVQSAHWSQDWTVGARIWLGEQFFSAQLAQTSPGSVFY